jgi:short-subunit dehydrogenase
MPAEKVARIGHQAFRQGKVVAIAGFKNQALAFSTRLAPRSLARKVAGWFNAAR